MTDTSPDKIGWLFIQEYYSRLNSDPLHLYQFYTKNSTLIHGFEGESAVVAKGQAEIQARVKQQKLFRDCNVLVSSVDCLGSHSNGILMQVTGEMNNVSGRNVKFAQTFFLAPSEYNKGYYVLNDILRFMGEDEEADNEENWADEVSTTSSSAVPSEASSAPTSTPAPTPSAPSGPSIPIPGVSSGAAPAAANAAATSTPTTTSNSSSTSTAAKKKKVFYSAYLKNVVPEVDQQLLREKLETAGQVTHLQIETDKSRAFVDFIDQDSLDRALEMQIIQIGNVNVVIEPRKRRKPVK